MPRPHSCHEAEQGTQTGPATSSSSSQVEAWDGLGQAVLLRQSLHKRQACELITAMLQDPGVIFLCSSSEAQPVVPGTGFITERYAVGALFFHTQGFAVFSFITWCRLNLGCASLQRPLAQELPSSSTDAPVFGLD